MRQDGALWASAPDNTGREQGEVLALLDESQYLLGLILLGVVLQYLSLDVERKKLLCAGAQGDPKAMQVAASLVTLGALFGFQGQSQRLGEQCDIMLGANSIVIALLRLCKLMGNNTGETQAQQAIELDEPVI